MLIGQGYVYRHFQNLYYFCASRKLKCQTVQLVLLSTLTNSPLRPGPQNYKHCGPIPDPMPAIVTGGQEVSFCRLVFGEQLYITWRETLELDLQNLGSPAGIRIRSPPAWPSIYQHILVCGMNGCAYSIPHTTRYCRMRDARQGGEGEGGPARCQDDPPGPICGMNHPPMNSLATPDCCCTRLLDSNYSITSHGDLSPKL